MSEPINWNKNEWAGQKIFDFDEQTNLKLKFTLALMDEMVAKGWTIEPDELDDEEPIWCDDCQEWHE